MNIVFGSDSFLPVLQGITTHMILYARQLASHGHKVLIIASDYPSYVDQPLGEGITVARIKAYSIADIFKANDVENRLVNPFNKKIVQPILNEFKPDLIHCHTEFFMGRILLSYAKQNKVPIVMTAHIYFEYYMQFYFPWLHKSICRAIARSLQYHFFKHANLLISPTLLMKEKLQEYGINKDVEVIPTGTILEDFKVNDGELEKFKEKNPFFKNDVLLFVGRLVAEKNVDFVLEAFLKIIEKRPNIKLAYIGKGVKLDSLKKKVVEKGLEESVIFYGPIPREQLKYYYHSSKLFIFPSIGETQGLVVLEAMASGIPVVGIDAMGVGETMEHRNYGGLLSPMNDLDHYVSNVLSLLSDQDLYKEKSKEALEIATKWSIAPMYSKLESCYTQLIADYSKISH